MILMIKINIDVLWCQIKLYKQFTNGNNFQTCYYIHAKRDNSIYFPHMFLTLHVLYIYIHNIMAI